jgi:PrtD family type I secretion system ABC transporter
MTDTRTHARNQRTALKEALRRSRGGFIAVALFSLCINMLMLAAPLYMMQLYDRVLSSRNIDTLVLLTIMAAGAILTMSLLDMIRGQAMVRLGGWIDRKVSPDLLTASIAQTLRRGETPSVQGLRDLGTFRTFLTGPAMFPIMDAPWTPIFLAVIFMLHPVLGWVATGGAMVLSALAVANELSTRKLLQMSGGASIMALQQAEAAARNADVIEAMGMMPALVRRWHERNSQHVTLQAMASHRSGAIGATSKFVRLLLQIGILGAGAYLAIQTEISPGAMIAASIIMGRALSPVEQAIGSWRSGIAARNAYGRIKTQLEEEPPRGERMRLPEPKGALNVEAVSYVHPSADEPVLRNISFALEPGESLGLIGPTAAGKTTLARLLVGNILPRAGHIRIDGADVAVWESEDRGKHVGYLPQDVELFAGTVRENIARMGECSPEAVVAAARMAGVHELILGLPKGYDTEIGEGGAALSGGQRQRIGLARALFGSPRFVVLDEPNASLDHEGEAALLQALRDLKDRNVTVVVIAHRPTILQHVDKILVLRDGQVQHFGAPADVVPKVTGQQRPAPPRVVTGGGGEGG